LDFALSRRDEEIRERAREFARDVLQPDARRHDEQGYFDRDKVKLLGDSGLLGGPLPVVFGGGEWSFIQWALATAELGAVDSSWRGFVTVQTNLVGLLIATHATAAQKQELLPKLISGDWIYSYALTEPEAGTDVASLKTNARRDGDHFVLDGEKIWITNGGVADQFLVFATVDPSLGKDGITCFLVPGDAKGLHRGAIDGHELGHRASNHATLHFEGVRLHESRVLGQVGGGFKVAMSGLDDGRLGVAAGAVGIQQACESASIDFARTRRQFGKRIGDFQLIQSVLTDLHVNLEASLKLTLSAAWLRDEGRRNTREVSVAKYFACESAVKAADQAVLLHGARGYSSAYPVERYLRDAKGLQIYEGTSHIQRIIIARDLLGKEQR
jgi:alkylation response protein AidB-like acyl-CoA dehydrogenase